MDNEEKQNWETPVLTIRDVTTITEEGYAGNEDGNIFS